LYRPHFGRLDGEGLDLTIVDLPGIGDWAVAQINKPDPTFGIEEPLQQGAARRRQGGPGALADLGAPQPEACSIAELAISRL
jgi:hypothetical protein